MIDIQLQGSLYNVDESELEDLYLSVGPNIGKELDGEFFLQITDGDMVTSVSDFGGTHTAGIMPRNSTIVTVEGVVAKYKNNVDTSCVLYDPPQGLKKRDNYDHVFEAIDQAVLKRMPETRPVVFLSGGHDSGTIAASMIKSGLDFTTVSAAGNEPMDILEERWRIIEQSGRELIKVSESTSSVDEYKQYETMYNEEGMSPKFKNVSSHYIVSRYVPNRVMLSGLGADELYVSRDDQLLDLFMRSSGHVYHHFNIDVRYPLLDKNVFIEYYRLKHELRRRFKQPFEKYLAANSFAVNMGPKVGFYLFDDY